MVTAYVKYLIFFRSIECFCNLILFSHISHVLSQLHTPLPKKKKRKRKKETHGHGQVCDCRCVCVC